jgi:hypothetical protein
MLGAGASASRRELPLLIAIGVAAALTAGAFATLLAVTEDSAASEVDETAADVPDDVSDDAATGAGALGFVTFVTFATLVAGDAAT